MNIRYSLLSVLLVLGTSPLAAQSNPELAKKVDARRESLFGQDSPFRLVTPLRGRPFSRQGGVERTALSLVAGYEYVLLVVCGDECEKNPPTISVPVGGDPDQQRGRQEVHGVYRVTDVEFDGTIQAEVRLPPCQRDNGKCSYALAVFRRKGSAPESSSGSAVSLW